MAKAYWVATYRSISDPGRLGRLRQARRPGDPGRGRPILARGTAAKAYEAGVLQRVVVVEFPSVFGRRSGA